MTAILEDIVAEGERLLGLAVDADVDARLLGGVAVRLHAPAVPDALAREYKDLDFAIPKSAASRSTSCCAAPATAPHVSFNAMHARERALFFDDHHGRQVDVFIDSLRMCHQIPRSPTAWISRARRSRWPSCC